MFHVGFIYSCGRWAVENQIGKKNLAIDDCDTKQSVYVYGCKDSVLHVKGDTTNLCFSVMLFCIHIFISMSGRYLYANLFGFFFLP